MQISIYYNVKFVVFTLCFDELTNHIICEYNEKIFKYESLAGDVCPKTWNLKEIK